MSSQTAYTLLPEPHSLEYLHRTYGLLQRDPLPLQHRRQGLPDLPMGRRTSIDLLVRVLHHTDAEDDDRVALFVPHFSLDADAVQASSADRFS